MILLDTHIWIWWINEPDKLDSSLLNALDNIEVGGLAISIISVWEIAKLIEKKRIDLKMDLSEWLTFAIDRVNLVVLGLSNEIIIESCNLPSDFHNDPADQLIVATAIKNKMFLATVDHKILNYPHVNIFK